MQLEKTHAGLGHHAVDLFFERPESAFAPQFFLRHAGFFDEQCFARRDCEYWRSETELLLRRVLKVAMNYFDLGTVTQVGLLKNEDDVLEPFLLHEMEQLPARLRPRIRHRKNEQHYVRPRNETFSDRLMLRDHRVGSWSIDDVEILEERDRKISLR